MTDPITHEAAQGIRQLEAYLAQQLPIPHQTVPRLPLARHQRNLLDLGFDPDCSGLAPANDGERLAALDYLNDERTLEVDHHDVSTLDRHRSDLAGAAGRHLCLVGDPEGEPTVRRYWSQAARRQRERTLFWRRVRYWAVTVLAIVAFLWAVQGFLWAIAG